MKTIKLICFFLIFTLELFSQGTNNDFDYDKEDFNVIFKELGISTFKFPIKQNPNQLFNIIIEEYENGELIKKISVIEDSKSAFEQYGIDALSYFKPKRDSVYFHRFYFFKNDSTIKIRVKTHGIETVKDFSLKGKSLYSINANNDIGSKLRDNQYIEVENEPEILLYLYANSVDENNKPLWCPNGLSKEKLLERFYYFIFITIEPYKEE
jgi:hypothetical protein